LFAFSFALILFSLNSVVSATCIDNEPLFDGAEISKFVVSPSMCNVTFLQFPVMMFELEQEVSALH